RHPTKADSVSVPTTGLPKKMVSGSASLLFGPKKPEELKIPIPKSAIDHFIKCARLKPPKKPISDFWGTIRNKDLHDQAKE
ncbi:Os12g0254201, partial [Oryza sativa Japonica Group]